MRRSPGEFELIERLCARLRQGPRVIAGPGDDCAILAASRTAQLFTIDSTVEGVHFNLDWAAPKVWGSRALTVNLSDIAAMGGRPTACVVNLAVRQGLPPSFFDQLYQGLRSAAAKAGVDVVGGNITRADQIAITIALLGEAGRRSLRRDCARIGDQICVTRTLGDAAAGWRILDGTLPASGRAKAFLVNRFLNPTAHLAAGQRLAALKPTPAAIDVSDGLCQDLGHILERSRVGAELDAAAIPTSPAYRALFGDDLDLALSGGEDYELLFCLSPIHDPRRLSSRLGIPVSRIGKIVPARRGLTISNYRGGRARRRDRLEAPGWDQLRSRG